MGLIKDFRLTRYRKEISAYTGGLEKLDDNLIGRWLAEAIILRMQLENGLTVPRFFLSDGSLSPDPSRLRLMKKALRKKVGLLKQDDVPSRSHSSLIDEQLLILWILTINMLLYPELKEDGDRMWSEIKRGMSFVPAELDKIIARMKEEKNALSDGSRKRALDILAHLPPEPPAPKPTK